MAEDEEKETDAAARKTEESAGSELGTLRQVVTASLYMLLNIVASVSVVFVNKIIFYQFGFKCVTALTLVHTTATYLGMLMMGQLGFYEPKRLDRWAILPLAGSFSAYVVLSNMSLSLNSVGLYQILKIATAPTCMLLEFLMFGKTRTRSMGLAVALVCMGVTYATVTDKVVIKNLIGLSVGLASTVVTAVYLTLAGSKQKDLSANSSQLLLAFAPQAMVILTAAVPVTDPVGWGPHPPPTSLLGFKYTSGAVAVILLSAGLGVLVTLSTFLAIGATSGLTYNVVGHSKTLLVIIGACVFLGETMAPERVVGLCITAVGIAWYTVLNMQPSPPSTTPVSPAMVQIKANPSVAEGLLDQEKLPLLGSLDGVAGPR